MRRFLISLTLAVSAVMFSAAASMAGSWPSG